MDTNFEKKYKIEAVDSALDVIFTITHQPGLGVTDIANATGMTKSRAFRLLKTLTNRGIVSLSETSGYHLGTSSLLIGACAMAQVDLISIATPALEALSAKVNETAILRLREGRKCICVAKHEPARDLRVHAVVGRRRSFLIGSGNVVPAFLSQQERENIVSELSFPQARKDQLLRKLMAIRTAGYSVSNGEVNSELVGIAAPIFSADGTVIAAMSIAAPAHRTHAPEIDETIPLVVTTARQVSQRLGWQGALRS
ncbi:MULTISPECIES: IclR family transcriptional regulator [Alphaproteobacteria]|uniref:IclR family transcriptional regulator n=1 Tax=Alphaproteobacteria TaxID=28211 RepID=UPI003A9259E2